MATKIRLGYDILAKRAIETESGINIDDALRRIHSYEMVGSTGEDKHPDVPSGSESSKILYVTKLDHTAWIWSTDTSDPGWICIGGAGDSWKTWSEEHGSTADGIENAVYIGPDNDIEREDTFILGDGNTVKTTDDTDYSGTEVITIGLENHATNAAIAYQLGRHNAIIGNNLANKQQYPNQLSMNLGDSNVINGEGINIGKCNTSTGFGITLGQNNTAQAGSLVLGSGNAGGAGSIVVGKSITLNTAGSILFGDRIRLVSGDTGGWSGGVTAFGMDIQVSNGSLAVGRDRILANNGSVVIGVSNVTGTGGSIALGHDGCSATDGSISVGSSISSGSGSISIGKYGSSTGGGIHIGMYNSGLSSGIAIGNSNTANGMSSAIGYRNTVSGTSFIYGTGNNATATSVAIGTGNDARSSSIFIGGTNTRGESIIDNSGDGIGIAVGNQNILTNGAFNISLGQSNEVGYEAIALGNNNTVYGWSAAIGYNNQTVANRGAHAMMLGSYNTSNSTLEYLEKTYQQSYSGSVTVTKQIYNNSLISGSYNTSNHYNSILIGSYNTSNAPARGESSVSDDDGFVVAIGFENTVGRNYDFAYGYQSTADGGENIAFQHSTATGYRNIAMVDSTLTNCTANIALCESKLTLNPNTDNRLTVIHNTLLHSDISIPRGGVSNNLFLHTIGGFATDINGVHRNIVMVGTEKHPLSVTGSSATDNIIYGFRRGYFIAKNFSDDSGDVAINATNGSVSRNLMLANAYGKLNASAMNDNIIYSSELNVDAAIFTSNFVLDSLLNQTKSCDTVQNIILNKSKIDIVCDAEKVAQNFLMYSYLGDSANGNKIQTGEYGSGTSTTYMTQNFLYGTNAYHVQNTVSFATPNYDQAPEVATYNPYWRGESPQSATLIDCCNIFNWGDNLIKGANSDVVFGVGHNIHSSYRAVIFGNANETAYTTGSIVMGERNKVLSARGSSIGDVTHTVIIGSNNNVTAACEADYNMIFGTGNTIQGNNYAGTQKTYSQVASLPADTKEYFYTTTDCIRPTSDTVYAIYKDRYYLYSNARLYQSYSAPSSSNNVVEYSSTSSLAYAYSNRTLTEGTWYKPTSGSSYTIYAPSGTLISAYTLYYHYNDTLVGLGSYSSSSAIYTSFNRIFGNANTVCDHVVNYTLMGSSNIVKCDDFISDYKYAISNGFVQGNNNIAKNGSNIVSMGNGNDSTGHNSVAIGCQLQSKQWQTVIGKYNSPIDGPDRLTSPSDSSQANKALFIVGNGYSTKDDGYWQYENYITRSNALELYANGRLKVAGALEGSSLAVTGAITGGSLRVTGMVDAQFILTNNGIFSNGPVNASNIPYAPSQDGTYTLQCVVTDGTATYSWAPVGFTTVS